VATASPITGGTITGAGTIGLDTTLVAQKFFGTAAPGSVSGNLPGDLFTDTTAHNEYVCNAPAGTAAPACTSVTAAGWLLVNSGAAGTVTHTGGPLTANSVILGNGGADVKPGAVLPVDATKFYSGANTFITPPTGAVAASNLMPVTVSANTTGDQILQEISLPTGVLNSQNAANLIHGSGILTIGAGQTPALTFKAKLCTVPGCGSGTVVTLATITTSASVAATNNGWNLQLMVGAVSIGSAGTLYVHGAPGLTVDIGALPGSAATLYADTNTAVTSAIDLTGALFVDFTVATSVGSTLNSITQQIADSLPWAGPGVAGGFLHSRSLTISHSQCGASDSLNFPVLVSISDTTFKTAPNGGHIQNANGYDIVFAADAAGVTQYPWEIESYNGTTGVLVAWVQIPTVSHTVDTVFYVLYDNPSITTAQNTGSLGPTHVWDTNYVAVWHVPNGTVLTATDSTSNAINGTLVNTPTATAGQIDGAASFASASSQYISLGTPAALELTGAFTVETWIRTTTQTGCRILSNLQNSGGFNGYDIYQDAGVISMQIGKSGTLHQVFTPAVSPGNTYHYAGTFNGSTTGIAYLNGSPGAPDAGFPGLGAGSNAYISRFGVSASGFCNGWLDEVRLSNIARSADWILTGYNNQNAPGNIGSANFITYGPEI
jgi:hypothetical protein